MKYFIYLFIIMISPIMGSSIHQLVTYGVKHSPIIQTVIAEAELSQLNHKASKTEQYGELNLVGDYTHYNIERTLAPLPPSTMMSGASITTSKDIFSIGLSYSVPLFTGYAQTRQIEIDNIASMMSQNKIKLTREQLIYNIKSLYLTILLQKEVLNAQKSYTQALQELKNMITQEVSFGKKAEIDLLKAKANLSASLTQQKILESNIDMTKATLSSIVGKDVGRLSPIKIVIKKPKYSIASLTKKISNLTKIKIENFQLQKADKMIAKAKASSMPQINLNSYLGKNFGEDIKSDDWDDETLWHVGIKAQYNLVDFGKRAIGEEKARVSKLKAQIHKQQLILDTKKLITQAIEKIKLSYAEYTGNSSQYKLSRKSEQIEQVRYENGASSLNDLLFAKSKTQLSRAKVIESKYNYKKSKYYLDYILERGIK